MTNNIKEGRIFYYVDISTGRRIGPVRFSELPKDGGSVIYPSGIPMLPTMAVRLPYIDAGDAMGKILLRRLPVSPVNKLDDIGGTE